MKPYSVVTPNFKISSGGIRVMWGLYGWLLAKGQIVNVNTKYPDSDFVAIYPEIYHGNPMEANTVVRYILQKPGMMGKGTPGTRSFKPGPTKFDPKDKLFAFSRLYLKNLPESHYLFLPIIDMHLFCSRKGKRTKKFYYVGKGKNTNQHPSDAIELPRMQDQQELADMLNDCQVLYIYDPVTALSEVARLCGCRVVMISPMEGFKKDYEPGMNGISLYKDDGVKLNYTKFRKHYNGMREIFSRKLDDFIEITQK
ncbi:MAG: hypothetical protein A3B47_03865 [Candidatus Levybacteria bacterium RIFCSPLOWO2_01_FULL_39_24]|nr:MAG: hypothetical protein A2800_03670 [Candidatus Levybacteria bacterium RIFCSPHIGHO2_01_FULL_40_16]OGH46372.1 MAG: hypothetical protein A3B47_03865 [Candidatus Levybacteria bacterium RIFCSPLOWO2_01_FULL_39_24]